MRKYLFLLLIPVAVIAQTAQGDTIHLKNGSVLRGKVTSFADDQFIVMIDTGSGRYMSRAMVYTGDVARIEFDSAPSAAGEAAITTAPPAAETSTRGSETSSRGSETSTPRETKRNTRVLDDPPARTTPPADTQRETGPPEPQPAPVEPEKTSVTSSPSPVTTTPVSESSESDRLPRKPLVAIKTMTVDVVARKDWTSSGLIVKRGDRLRVTASGTITLDPVTGRTTGPEGISDLADPKKLMLDQPTGALIGVISSDNDDFIFIGRSNEFTAMRDGLLFLSVNEGVLPDNLGTFKAVVEVLSPRK